MTTQILSLTKRETKSKTQRKTYEIEVHHVMMIKGRDESHS